MVHVVFVYVRKKDFSHEKEERDKEKRGHKKEEQRKKERKETRRIEGTGKKTGEEGA